MYSRPRKILHLEYCNAEVEFGGSREVPGLSVQHRGVVPSFHDVLYLRNDGGSESRWEGGFAPDERTGRMHEVKKGPVPRMTRVTDLTESKKEIGD